MDTTFEFKYWPCDLVPVFSKPVLATLRKDDDCKKGQDIFGMRSIVLAISFDKLIEIPKIITSRNALVFLGFTPTRAQEIWRYIIMVPESLDGPDIERGGAFYFWKDLTEFVDTKIIAARKHADYMHGRAYSKKLLDDIGLTNEVQMQQGLRIKTDDNNNGESNLTCLQAQMPENAVALAKQYIRYRWDLLLGLGDIIAKGGNWKEGIVAKITQDPIDFTALQISESNSWSPWLPPTL